MSDNSPEPDPWLEHNDTSTPGWQQRAIGMPTKDALATIPRTREMACVIRIRPWRAINAHIKRRGLRQGEWVRRAIIAHYLSEGGDPDIARAAHDTYKHPKRPD